MVLRLEGTRRPGDCGSAVCCACVAGLSVPLLMDSIVACRGGAAIVNMSVNNQAQLVWSTELSTVGGYGGAHPPRVQDWASGRDSAALQCTCARFTLDLLAILRWKNDVQ